MEIRNLITFVRIAELRNFSKTAQELGYTRVYNLGALSDWPYGITHD